MAKRITPSESSIEAHLASIRAVIDRMSSNCASTKAWCVTIVSAVLVLAADKDRVDFTLVAIVPCVLFLALDAFYLGLERGFRRSYDSFLQKWSNGLVRYTDLYWMKPEGNRVFLSFKALLSFSIWPFYGTLALLSFLSRYVLCR
jgi:hypothetical protein